MEQLLCHLIGDYWLQNDWMALNKKKQWWVAFLHSAIYTLPFMFLTHSVWALFVICITHTLIDGSHIVEKLTRLKNWHGLDTHSPTYNMCKIENQEEIGHTCMLADMPRHISEPGGILGYSPCRPAWLCVMLSIVQDNTLHLICNYFTLLYL